MEYFGCEYCAECENQKPLEKSNYRLCPDCREDLECDEDWFK